MLPVSISPILLKTMPAPLSITVSAKESQLIDELFTEITGALDPEARSKKVNRSRLSAGIDPPRRTKSKSPTRNHSIASRIELVQVTKYPADCHFRRSASLFGESRPTARMVVEHIISSRIGDDNPSFQRTTGPIALASLPEAAGIPGALKGGRGVMKEEQSGSQVFPRGAL
jgi:hypothetical protein